MAIVGASVATKEAPKQQTTDADGREMVSVEVGTVVGGDLELIVDH